ncbi:Hypothetical predicted protein [Mytilus galloprovincialis]|uniref:Reverse transcriptase domain-containing protein n=1 Tax=Mytilus galloprovincialis TaxID=29158 RepID=A0A8B6GU77_MYTGA|nr:Hypothetical predicted protein [Mytilus galloprovincialis]
MTPELRNEVIQTVNALIHSPATVTSPDSINESQQLNTGITPNILPVYSVNDNLGLNVSQQTQDKIINGEYVDLSILLTNSSTEQSSSLTLDTNGQLVIQAKPSKKITDINTWIDAFLIYTSIYVGVHLEDTQNILKYMYSVKLGASRSIGLGWKDYDQQFRLKKARNPALSWATVDQELWLLYIIQGSQLHLVLGLIWLTHKGSVTSSITKVHELESDRIAGPFSCRPFKNLRLSPIGLVPKKPSGWRLIHHLSYPFGKSVNSFIDPQNCSVQYTSFDKVLNTISEIGPKSLMGRMDVSSAFRLIPLHPDDSDLFGFKFDDNYFFQKALPMGLAAACNLFEKFATFVEWIGEIVRNKKWQAHQVIAIENVTLSKKDYIEIAKIVIPFSKTDQYGHGTVIEITETKLKDCPIYWLKNYLMQRPKVKGPLFCHFGGCPVTRFQFSSVPNESSIQQELNSIWVVGSSIVKHAFIEAKRSFDGCSLGLHRKSYRVWWQGKGGMKWGELVPRIKFLLQIDSPPKILVIHCGGNSIGAISLFDLRETLRSDIMKLHEMLPQTKIVWSQFLPRFKWRYGKNQQAMNIAATRINNFAAWLCMQLGGCYIKYPEIS